jgi:hypothetical protein
MEFAQVQLDELKSFYPDIGRVIDGGVDFILIRNIRLPDGCHPPTVDGLLCPTQRDGYPSRLFLAQKITHSGLGQSWNAAGVQIAGSQWWAVSWKIHKDRLTLLGIVLAHCEAFKPRK